MEGDLAPIVRRVRALQLTGKEIMLVKVTVDGQPCGLLIAPGPTAMAGLEQALDVLVEQEALLQDPRTAGGG
jgi:hypothetical protein